MKLELETHLAVGREHISSLVAISSASITTGAKMNFFFRSGFFPVLVGCSSRLDRSEAEPRRLTIPSGFFLLWGNLPVSQTRIIKY